MAIIKLDELQQAGEPVAMAAANVNQPMILGPFDEGSSVNLACIADFGEPDRGQISWWRAIDLTAGVNGDNNNIKSSSSILRNSGPIKSYSNSATNQTSLLYQWDQFDNYMTTMSLVANSNNNLYRNNEIITSNDYSHYFVAFHKSAQQSSQKRVSLPYPTKLWTRIIPANSNLQANISPENKDDNYQINNIIINNNQQQQQLKSVLNLSPLKRSHLDQEFICLAANNKISPPLNVTIKLNLNCKYSR